MKEKLVDSVLVFLSNNPWVVIILLLIAVLVAIFGKVHYQNQSGIGNKQAGRDFNEFTKARRRK